VFHNKDTRVFHTHSCVPIVDLYTNSVHELVRWCVHLYQLHTSLCTHSHKSTIGTHECSTIGTHQCVAVCCSVLQCVAVCCSVLQCVGTHECSTIGTHQHMCSSHVFFVPGAWVCACMCVCLHMSVRVCMCVDLCVCVSV